MIGVFHHYSGLFLIISSIGTILLGTPMLFTPLGWAKVLRWRIPGDTDLAVYFGRCLGGVVTVIAAMGFIASQRPLIQPFYFDLVLTMIAVNILIHLWGAIRKIQPLTETVEIAAWIVLFIAGLLFYPAG